MTRFRNVSAALTLVAIVALSTPAGATINENISQHEAEIACGGAVQNATLMLRLAPSDPDGKMPQATKDYQDDLNRCPSPRYANVAKSWATFAKAIVDHRTGVPYASDLDEAIGHLTTCVSDFQGSISDHCQTGLGHAKQAKIDWASGTISGTAAAPAASP